VQAKLELTPETGLTHSDSNLKFAQWTFTNPTPVPVKVLLRVQGSGKGQVYPVYAWDKQTYNFYSSAGSKSVRLSLNNGAYSTSHGWVVNIPASTTVSIPVLIDGSTVCPFRYDLMDISWANGRCHRQSRGSIVALNNDVKFQFGTLYGESDELNFNNLNFVNWQTIDFADNARLTNFLGFNRSIFVGSVSGTYVNDGGHSFNFFAHPFFWNMLVLNEQPIRGQSCDLEISCPHPD
jgi:hypothetical protein